MRSPPQNTMQWGVHPAHIETENTSTALPTEAHSQSQSQSHSQYIYIISNPPGRGPIRTPIAFRPHQSYTHHIINHISQENHTTTFIKSFNSQNNIEIIKLLNNKIDQLFVKYPNSYVNDKIIETSSFGNQNKS